VVFLHLNHEVIDSLGELLLDTPRRTPFIAFHIIEVSSSRLGNTRTGWTAPWCGPLLTFTKTESAAMRLIWKAQSERRAASEIQA